MKDSIKKAACFVAMLVLCVSAASQAATSIAFVHNTANNVDYLTTYGYSVTSIKDPLGLTAAQLSSYDAVVVTPAWMFTESAAVGNALAGFADAGGGVVLSGFCYQGQWAVQGQIMTPGYSPFTPDPSNSGYGIVQTGFGVVHDPSHPIFDGVNTANVPTYWQANVGLAAGATLLAEWPSGRDALAFNTLSGGNSIVGMTLYPADLYSNSMMNDDSRLLVANAVAFSIGSGDSGSAPTVPVPGAAVLGCLGLGLTGWLRKRRSL